MKTVIDLCHKFPGLFIVFQANLKKRYIIRFKKGFYAQAITALLGSVHYDLGREEAVRILHTSIIA